MSEGMFDDLFGLDGLDPPADDSLIPHQGPRRSNDPDLDPVTPVSPARQRWASNAVFDIETGPAAEEELEPLFEVDLSKVKDLDLIGREFDPATVKLGNTKDGAKIAAKIDEKRREFMAAQAAAQDALDSARDDQWRQFTHAAALSAVTGRVLAIGYGFRNDGQDIRVEAGECSVAIDTDEPDGEAGLLTRFWQAYEQHRRAGTQLIGFNIFNFDLPFLVRRSWRHDVDVPDSLIRDDRFWDRVFVDLAKRWSCGVWGEHIKLDRVCQFFGAPRKNGDGAMFHRLYHGSADEVAQAIDYLSNDIRMTFATAVKMGAL